MNKKEVRETIEEMEQTKRNLENQLNVVNNRLHELYRLEDEIHYEG